MEWVRYVGPQLGINVEKLILGMVLDKITNDDANTFFLVACNIFAPEIAAGAKQSLLERMRWEIDTPETPQKIRERLESTLQSVSSLDWTKRKEFDQAEAEWYRLRDWVREQRKENQKFREAYEYYLASAETGRLSEYWAEFLYKSR